RIEARKALHTPEQLEQQLREQKGKDEKDIDEVERREHDRAYEKELTRITGSVWASGAHHQNDRQKIYEHDFRQQQGWLPGLGFWDTPHAYAPPILVPTKELIRRFREWSDVEDDAVLHKALDIAEMERRFNAGERDGHFKFEHWCAEFVPEHEWPYLRR